MIYDYPIILEPEEVWAEKKPRKGDHIRVQRLGGVYYHHGVYVSDDEVIHFTGTDDDSILDWSKNEVISSDLKFFLNGGTLEVKEYTDEEIEDLYPPDAIVSYARACLGDRGYNLIFNNCEHFANVCTLGRFRSNQVENILGGKKKMGLFSWLGNLFGGSKSRSTSHSETHTTYEPDKVKAAQIEADARLKIAGMENERIELMKNARLELMRSEAESKIAVERAKAQGFTMIAQAVAVMQEKLNEIAEKRITIIEKCSLQSVREAERFYDELSAKIQEDDDKYNTEKLPELLAILERYEEGTPAHGLYMRRIEQDMMLQAEHYTKQLDAVLTRQEQIINGILNTKQDILLHTSNITNQILEGMQKNILSLDSQSQNLQALPEHEKLALPPEK